MSTTSHQRDSRKLFVGRTGPGLHDELERGLDFVNWDDLIPSGARVAVKPNFCWPSLLPGVTTSISMLEALFDLLSSRTSNLSLVESDGISFPAEDAFAAHDAAALCRQFDAKLVNLSLGPAERRTTEVAGSLIEFEYPAFLLHDIDVLISAPVLKTHVITGASLGLKNLWGCLPDSLRVLRHHQLNPGIVAIAKELGPKLTIIDATFGLDRRGPVFGDAIPVGKFILSNDPLAADIAGLLMLGFEPERVEHLRLAAASGMGTLDLTRVELGGEPLQREALFSLHPTVVDRASNLTYHSALVSRLIHGSLLTKPIYTVTRRQLPVPNQHRRQPTRSQ